MRIAYESNYCLAKLLTVESDVFANSREHLRGDAEERGNSVQRQVLHNTWATL